MGSSSLAAMTLWCRVLALLAIITFVVSNQSVDPNSGALDTSYDESLDFGLNHIITKRDAKDPEKKKKKKDTRRKGGVRKKRLEKKRRAKGKVPKRKERKNKKGINKIKNQNSKLKNKKRKDNKAKKGKKNGKSIKKRNKGKNTKRKQSKKKNNKKKNNKNERKLRKQRKRKHKKLSRQDSCSSSQANFTCMAAALKGLMFEQQQITNYLKQSKLLERHQSVSGNKQGKKNAFEEAEQHLLWAIGGDIDNPICGPNDTSSSKYNSSLYEYEKNLAVESYKVLRECDIAIEKACNISLLEDYDKTGHAENTTLCQNMKQDAIANNKRCQSLTEDVAAQCACWINQTIVIDRIKKFKCQAKSTQKLVTQHKNECINTFKECKKKEDKSVESVYYCMHDHSMSFINQTTESLANAATKNSKTAAIRKEQGERNLLQLQEFLDGFDYQSYLI